MNVENVTMQHNNVKMLDGESEQMKSESERVVREM